MNWSLTPVFGALADDTRCLILTRLSRTPASASALARDLPVSRQTLVKHLEVLWSAGLVESRQQGRELVYSTLAAGSKLLLVTSRRSRAIEKLHWPGSSASLKARTEPHTLTPSQASRISATNSTGGGRGTGDMPGCAGSA